MILTDERWQELVKVQSEVNADVRYKTDIELYGKFEFWEIADGEGDCEDSALVKREKLLGLEWDKDDLALATCWTETNAYHAVLVVHTDKGDYVLDNRYPRVMAWKVLPYKWDKIQDGKKWRSIGDKVQVIPD